jgi:DNA-binding MarR family transcriptional regulator
MAIIALTNYATCTTCESPEKGSSTVGMIKFLDRHLGMRCVIQKTLNTVERTSRCDNYFKMTRNEMGIGQPAFLLAQLGAHAATQFAERLRVIDFAPQDAGILRLLRTASGVSQQELAGRLGIHPSRLVALLDGLEKRRFVERKPNPDDRRLYSLHLTEAGVEALEKIGKVARQHQDALLSSLNNEERKSLGALLLRIADQQGLTRGVHPGYQSPGTASP